MSRIGKLPVSLPTGVSAELLPGNVVKVKGPHGEMSQKVDSDITVTIEDNHIKWRPPFVTLVTLWMATSLSFNSRSDVFTLLTFVFAIVCTFRIRGRLHEQHLPNF